MEFFFYTINVFCWHMYAMNKKGLIFCVFDKNDGKGWNRLHKRPKNRLHLVKRKTKWRKMGAQKGEKRTENTENEKKWCEISKNGC